MGRCTFARTGLGLLWGRDAVLVWDFLGGDLDFGLAFAAVLDLAGRRTAFDRAFGAALGLPDLGFEDLDLRA